MTTAQIVLLNRPSPSPFYRWRQIFLVLHARDILISIAGNAKKRSLTLAQPSPSYTTLQTHDADAGEVAQSTPTRTDITIDIPENSNINNPQQPFSASINVEKPAVIVKEKNLGSPSPSPFYRWRQIFLVLHARNILISIAGNAKKRFPTLAGEASQPSPSYTTLQTHDADAGEVAQTTPTRADITIHIDIPENNNINPQQSFSASINVESLTTIVKEKNLDCLCEFGGVKEIAVALDTNLDNGICSNPEEIRQRQDVYGRNIYCLPPVPAKRFLYYIVKASKDWTIFLLLCCAALSLGAGIQKEGGKDGWYDGATIFVAVFVLVTITSLSNYCHAIKLRKWLKMNTPGIDVQRDGCLHQILISDIVVGDVVCLKIGDKVPADGLFFDGGPLQVDEDIDSTTTVGEESPFLFSESKVVNGSARMLVTSVGSNTVWGETMKTVTHDPQKKTPLQRGVDKLNSYVQYVGLIFALFILVVLILRYSFGKQEDDENGYPDLKGEKTPIGDLMKSMERLVIRPRGMVSILTTLLTVFLVGVQEGLPFFISLSLCCWNKRMSVDHVIVEDLSTCVNMGSITTICTDKTGVLTFNKMEVDTFWFGEEAISKEVISSLTPEVLEVLHEGVGTPVLVPGIFNSPMEDPILPWAKMALGMDMELLKKTRIIHNPKASNSDGNRSRMLMRKNGGTEKTIHLHWKGAGEEILAMCSYYYNSQGIKKIMDQQKRLMFERIIGDMATKGLQSVAFAYKKIDKDNGYCEDDDDVLQEEGLILLGVVGLKPESRSIVEALTHAGVGIKLVSAEDLTILRAVAIDCGILVPDRDLDAAVLEGEKFRNLSEKERVEMVDQIRVIGSILPSDKLLMVKCLQQKGHLVAVTGTKTSDAPALKEADIGISVGTQCSETAKENSDIIILNGNFASVATVFKSGICAYRNIRKFIQLQLTMTISGLLINSITTVSLGDAPITTLQLFGVNLTVGTFGALALLTDQQMQTLMEVAPIPQTEPLITKAMWRNITAQALYQITVLVTFQFKGEALPGMTKEVKKTLIFNTFVLCQVFNQFNSRELEKKNVFIGILENRWFLVAVGASFVSQVVVVEFAESLAGTAKLNWEQWLACILSAVVSWPIDSVVKCIPGFPANRSNGPLGSHIGFISTPHSVPSTSESQLELPLIRDSSTRGSSLLF